MPESITNRDTQYAFDIVKAICTEVGPVLPCSTQEWARATIIQKELESHRGAGNAVLEEFTAATLMPFKMPHQMVAFYHQKWDGPEILTIEP